MSRKKKEGFMTDFKAIAQEMIKEKIKDYLRYGSIISLILLIVGSVTYFGVQ